MKKNKKRRCVRCVMDTSVPSIKFDENGICSFCYLHDKMENDFPTGEKGKAILQNLALQMKEDGEDNKYDCIVGFSGGRDSSYTLHYVKNIMGLRPLAVHFNDGFGNPTAGENMVKICKAMNVDLRTITSDWRESKDIRIAFLKASTYDIGEGTDVGIAAALYGVAAKENIKYIIIGQSFRTEGVAPLTWSYFDGKYLKAVHSLFGKHPLKNWQPAKPGFNLGFKEMIYYTLFKRIKTIMPLYYLDYVRQDIDELLKARYGWENTGAHYFDDLYQSLVTYLLRIKFGTDRRLYSYSALIRSGQIKRNEAIKKVGEISIIEDKKIINLCLKRLGIRKEEFNAYVKKSIKSFRDYPSNYNMLIKMKSVIRLLCRFNILPKSAFDKYFLT